MIRPPISSPADSQNLAEIKARFSASWDSAAQATPGSLVTDLCHRTRTRRARVRRRRFWTHRPKA
jgi:hypothetical protein